MALQGAMRAVPKSKRAGIVPELRFRGPFHCQRLDYCIVSLKPSARRRSGKSNRRSTSGMNDDSGQS